MKLARMVTIRGVLTEEAPALFTTKQLVVNHSSKERVKVISIDFMPTVAGSSIETKVLILSEGDFPNGLPQFHDARVLLWITTDGTGSTPFHAGTNDIYKGAYVNGSALSDKLFVGVEGDHETVETTIKYIVRVAVFELSDTELFELI